VRWLVPGPDRAGHLPELAVIGRPDGPAVTRAMPMRAPYRRRDPELKRALLTRAAQEHVSVSEVIRRAIGEYPRAS
jgi:hypothetical protein